LSFHNYLQFNVATLASIKEYDVTQNQVTNPRYIRLLHLFQTRARYPTHIYSISDGKGS